jgi:hypothetical protein
MHRACARAPLPCADLEQQALRECGVLLLVQPLVCGVALGVDHSARAAPADVEVILFRGGVRAGSSPTGLAFELALTCPKSRNVCLWSEALLFDLHDRCAVQPDLNMRCCDTGSEGGGEVYTFCGGQRLNYDAERSRMCPLPLQQLRT